MYLSASIEIFAEDWMITAGMIGLTRLFDRTDIGMTPLEEDVPNIITSYSIHLTEKHIELFSARYIEWWIKESSVVRRDVGRMEWSKKKANGAYNKIITSQASDPNQLIDAQLLKDQNKVIKECAKAIRKIMNDQYKKVEKYFPNTDECDQLAQVIEQLNQVEDYQDAEQIEVSVLEYERIMATTFIEEKLTLNYVKAVILGIFFGQASILQPSFNAKSKEEHIQQLNKDFSDPALRDLQLYERLHQEQEDGSTVESTIPALLQKYSDTHKPYKDWLRAVKKLNSRQDILQYFDQHISKCSIIEGVPATQSYEELTFSPLALSKKKAVNFYWEFDKKNPIPISAIARLLLFCVPIGMVDYNRRLGNEHTEVSKRFFGIVMDNVNFKGLVKLNNIYRLQRKRTNSWSESIIGLLGEMKHKAENIKSKNSYLFVEFHSEYQIKKTLLDYYHMPSYIATYLADSGYKLKDISDNRIRDLYLRKILQGHDPKRHIYELLRQMIRASFYEKELLSKSARIAINARYHLSLAKKGELQLSVHDSQINEIYEEGVKLRRRFVFSRPFESNATNIEQSDYRASGRKKLEGIVYRLLNAVNAGDKQSFLDTTFRIYLSANTTGARRNANGTSSPPLGIPRIFVDIFQEEELDFETIANTFIAALLGSEKRKADKAKDTSEHTQDDELEQDFVHTEGEVEN